MKIGDRVIGRGLPPFVIAEIGLNHGGSLDRALALVDAAAEAGANAIKLQSIHAAALVAPGCPAPAHVSAASLADFFATFELDERAHVLLAGRARTLGLAVMATPFSMAAVDMLERIDVDAIKIASGDLTWPQLIARCAVARRPLVISTGMATLSEISDAIFTARTAGAADLALLHCVSSYPVPAGQDNLRAVGTLATTFRVPVGLSDHGADTFAAPLAVALGGALYERHLVLPDDADAIDRAVSSTPSELAAAIAAMRRAHESLGSGNKTPGAGESRNIVASRRSLCAARDLPAGHVLDAADLIALRPATGLSPSALPRIIGARLTTPLAAGTALVDAHLDMSFVRRRHAS